MLFPFNLCFHHFRRKFRRRFSIKIQYQYNFFVFSIRKNIARIIIDSNCKLENLPCLSIALVPNQTMTRWTRQSQNLQSRELGPSIRRSVHVCIESFPLVKECRWMRGRRWRADCGSSRERFRASQPQQFGVAIRST